MFCLANSGVYLSRTIIVERPKSMANTTPVLNANGMNVTTDFNNTGSEMQSTSSTFPVSFYISVTFIWIPGTLINFTALILIIKDIRKAIFPAAILLLILCCCDLGAVIFSCVRHILVRYSGIQTYALCATLAFIYNFSKISSGTVNCLMTADRVLAICYPFLYKRYITVKSWVVGCIISGTLILLHSSFPLVGLGDVMIFRRSGPYCSALSFREDPIQRLYGMVFGILGVTFVLFVVVGNILIISTLIQLGNKVMVMNVQSEAGSLTDSKTGGETNSSKTTTPFEIAVAKLMVGFAVAYLTLGTPYNVRQCVFLIGIVLR